jgi:hypothetical protein
VHAGGLEEAEVFVIAFKHKPRFSQRVLSCEPPDASIPTKVPNSATSSLVLSIHLFFIIQPGHFLYPRPNLGVTRKTGCTWWRRSLPKHINAPHNSPNNAHPTMSNDLPYDTVAPFSKHDDPFLNHHYWFPDSRPPDQTTTINTTTTSHNSNFLACFSVSLSLCPSPRYPHGSLVFPRRLRTEPNLVQHHGARPLRLLTWIYRHCCRAGSRMMNLSIM